MPILSARAVMSRQAVQAGLPDPLIPPVIANLLGIWQIDGSGTVVGVPSTNSYTGRLNNATAITAAMGGSDTEYDITAWDDLSGNNNDATGQGSVEWRNTGGLLPAPYAQFGGVDHVSTAIVFGTAGTMYCVVQPDEVNTNQVMGSSSTSTAGARIMLRLTSGAIWFRVQNLALSTTDLIHSSTYAANDLLRLGMAWDATNLVGVVNGTKSSRTHARDTSGGGTLALGSGGSGTERMNGYATIFLAYGAMHESTQRAAMMTWLGANYA